MSKGLDISDISLDGKLSLKMISCKHVYMDSVDLSIKFVEVMIMKIARMIMKIIARMIMKIIAKMIMKMIARMEIIRILIIKISGDSTDSPPVHSPIHRRSSTSRPAGFFRSPHCHHRCHHRCHPHCHPRCHHHRHPCHSSTSFPASFLRSPLSSTPQSHFLFFAISWKQSDFWCRFKFLHKNQTF